MGSTWLFLFGAIDDLAFTLYPRAEMSGAAADSSSRVTAAGVGRLGSFRAERFRSPLIYLLATLQICFAGLYVFNRGEKIEVWSYLSSAETREAYLERRIDEFRVAKYVNEVLPKRCHFI